jgi:hypothetical protein
MANEAVCSITTIEVNEYKSFSVALNKAVDTLYFICGNFSAHFVLRKVL